MPTRAEQKEQRRQKILFCALELFVKKGYADTKISDIAKAAGMSVGLMFHYYESKEHLYEALVQMGVAGTNVPREMHYENPLDYFSGFIKELFHYAQEQPWVFYMFLLMGQARRNDGIPAHIRQLAQSVDQISQSAEIIRIGQPRGYFRKGDPHSLAAAFWCSVQGIMEEYAISQDFPLPEPEWILDIIRGEL